MTTDVFLDLAFLYTSKAKFTVYNKEINGKKRVIFNPNDEMRNFHFHFEQIVKYYLSNSDKDLKLCSILKSATAFKKGSNTLINAKKHEQGKYFYITDLKKAYENVDIKKLTAILIYIFKYDYYRVDFDIFRMWYHYEEIYNDKDFIFLEGILLESFSGMYGKGLAFGGPASPFLLNLYLEIFVNLKLRKYCFSEGINFTQYADDYVFSSFDPIWSNKRKTIRKIIVESSGFTINHQKSKYLQMKKGVVFVTKFGLELNEDSKYAPARLVFPKNKRIRLHGAIKSYLIGLNTKPEVVSGLVAEFLHYYNRVDPTKTDKKTFALCREFRRVSRLFKNI